MKHPERAEDYLEHIIQAITRAMSYMQSAPDFEAFAKNRQLQDAVVGNIEIIGEAVTQMNRAAPGFIDQHPELPWAQMRAMRNVVIHQYFAVALRVYG
ncbi:MAG TPA: HepT-like ribonuclease domain-containing protein [Methylocella sp.]|nr:HepT-like ribonuclease domain-containing protein [Methylocella sp.]